MSMKKVKNILFSFIGLWLSSFICTSIQLVFQKQSIIPKEAIFPNTGAILYAIILAPILEELIFRDGLIPALDKVARKLHWKYHQAIAIVISAGLFACYHLPQTFLLPFFINGLIYGVLRWKNQDNYSSIIAHILYNLSVSLPLFI